MAANAQNSVSTLYVAPVADAGLPAGFVPCQLLVISPAGVTFNPPAKLTVANSDHLPAGALVDLWAFDPQLASARVVGIGRVSTDGATVATEIGGVPGGSVVAMTPRPAGLAQIETQPKDIFSPSVLGGGDLATRFSPPGTRQLNSGRGLTFVYHSMTANPHPVIDTKAQLGPGQGLPQTLTTRLSVASVTQQTVLSTLEVPIPSGVHPPQCLSSPARCPVKRGALQHVCWNAKHDGSADTIKYIDKEIGRTFA